MRMQRLSETKFMASSNSSSHNSGEYVHRNIPGVDICFYDKLCVESYCWIDENAGTKKMGCPDSNYGCA
ncbi:hypothetical protein OROMI_033825 [Orobanche minor]